jgi:hypothetical protein
VRDVTMIGQRPAEVETEQQAQATGVTILLAQRCGPGQHRRG